MKFSQLSKYFEKFSETSSRLTITNLLAELFKELSPIEIDKTIYLLQGRVVPLYVKIESGMAERMVIKSVVNGLNLERKLFENYYKKNGDLGKAIEYFKKQIILIDEKDLSILEVYDQLYKLFTISGIGSQEKKGNILANLIRQLDSLSTRFIVRIPIGVMRLGFSDMTILDALSWSIVGDKSLRSEIERAYHVRPDLGFIAKVLKEKGVDGIKYIKPKIFTPIIMMRAERMSSGEEIIKQIGKCAVEPKFDGLRIQIHYKKNNQKEVRLYSRNLEDVTLMFPDIVDGVLKEVKTNEAIMEGEAIGFNPQTDEFLPFQETIQRKRKYDIEEKAKEIPLKLFAFEILYLDGESCLTMPFIKRRKKLESIINHSGDLSKDTILISPQDVIIDPKKLELKFDEEISKGLEGIIAKKLNGVYQPGARGWNWIKFKRSYSAKINDTIDCLVMGYDYGKGKRASFGIGAFLVGVYDEKNDKFVTMAKIGTGLKDDEWRELKVKSLKLKVKDKPNQYEVDKIMNVDVWLEPSIVVEIKADEITKSPVHTAGLALRFPRLSKFRDDRRFSDTTTLEEIKKLYKNQLK